MDFPGKLWYTKIVSNERKEGEGMPSDREAAEIKKAMAYDLITSLESNHEKKDYTRKRSKS